LNGKIINNIYWKETMKNKSIYLSLRMLKEWILKNKSDKALLAMLNNNGLFPIDMVEGGKKQKRFFNISPDYETNDIQFKVEKVGELKYKFYEIDERLEDIELIIKEPEEGAWTFYE
jgi:hypothetical protein